MKKLIFIYLIVLFLPPGLAPVTIGSFQLQPIDIFLYGSMMFATGFAIKQKQNLWRGNFWDIAFIWIVVSVTIALIKSFDVLGPSGGTKILVYSLRFLTFCTASYLVTFFIKQTGIEKTIKFIFWLTCIFIATGLLERFFIAIGMPGIFEGFLSLLGYQINRGINYSSDIYRISGIIGSPETFALVLCQLLPLVFALRFLNQKRDYKNDIVIALGILVISLTGTRTAFLAVLFVLGLTFLLSRYRMRFSLILVFITLVIGFSFAYSEVLWIRFNELFEGQSGNWILRHKVWKAAQILWQREPWTGHGFGSFEIVVERFFGHIAVDIRESILIKNSGGFDTACSLYWQLLCDLGIFGLLPFLFLFAQTIYLSLKVAFTAKNPFDAHLALAILGLTLWNILYGLTNGSIFLIRGATYLLISIYWLELGVLQLLVQRNLVTQQYQRTLSDRRTNQFYISFPDRRSGKDRRAESP